MQIVILIIFSFILGAGAGALIASKRKTRVPMDIEDSLKQALVTPPARLQIHKPSESEEMQRMRAETAEKKILYEEELSLMFKMGQEMFASVSFESVCKSIAESANKIINAQIVTLLLEDKAGETFYPIYSQGVKEELVNKMRLKKGEGISGWVAEHNQMLVKNNLEDDDWFKKQNKDEYFAGSLISIPLSIKERVIGVLNLSNKRTQQPFQNDEIEFLKGLTAEASLALQSVSLYEQIQDSYLRTITALAFALDARDSYTRQHSENVTKYAVAIAQQMNLKPQEIENIRRAGMLHDIGKIGIRDGVLLKPGRLNDEEYFDIKRHPAKGEAIVAALPFLKEEAKIIRHHHERLDGTGYPDGKKGEEIEGGARIMAVADSFDAMVESRVYRKALGMDKAREELRKNSGSQFDPQVVEAFFRVLDKKI